MSDILIKNMEMPKDGTITIEIRHDGAVDFIGNMGSNLGRLVDVKAFALPPHGDLVEIEKVKEGLRIYGEAGWWERNAPIVLEAST